MAVLLVCPSPRLHFIGAMVVIESRKERRSAAKLARFGHVPRHQCCCPPRSAEAADRQHTPLSAAVPAISPRLCFLGTVAVGRGRRVIAQNGCLMANNVAGGIAHGLTPRAYIYGERRTIACACLSVAKLLLPLSAGSLLEIVGFSDPFVILIQKSN